ncbi:aminotransferase, classes I and II family protein [Trichomonas vaginalis G3]|uniref:Aminotransferase, classes I and II family protein n=1 Tax=Trichomonas vaginalis (strain ATCC PRA-98 / G3) TaxID=412133 RepID=A2FN10_TRIV3|nr:1-aminocyclopropane-1-carboxylate synthase protein [Trichomonas vaginalis G3]EAX93708.1 aminotransferase, classes I and II family protein [Trichomonas vaginalis G3]KAI5504732.1 1-aminocyclopropane-1-carboxylate synthase protein [Trichomonas vaginalis G3]|eukprot:XP_001306638.1 aminotransferase, classes I and II family protein [Trichomonas vaginalis G3]
MSFKKTKYLEHLEKKPVPILGIGFMKCATNPKVVNLGTAENHLLDDFLVPLCQSRPEFTADHLTYGGGMHTENLRKGLAKLYEDHLGMKNVNPDQILFGSGISHLVERISFAFCEKGDLVLIPAPAYGCFEPDMYPCGCDFQYIDLNNLPPAPPENAKILLLTNPGNPIGEIIPNISEVLKWAFQNPNLHVFTDDVYALSMRGQTYTSIMSHPDADPLRTHHLYGISKDWGMAGFHIGIFYTPVKEVFQAVKTCMGCYCMGSDTCQILERIFCDYELRDKMIQTSKDRLIKNLDITEKALKEGGIEFLHCDGSLFIMINLSDIAPDVESEKSLWLDLIEKHNVHILPGANGFKYPVPGWFRLCFSVTEENLVLGLKYLVDGVKTIRAEKSK